MGELEATGILALWNDCAGDRLDTYEGWYAGEHLFERLGIPGVQVGRRYENPEISPRFFTYYETATPDVLTSEQYLERVNNPSPLTREIMTSIFLNMSRTICKRVEVFGSGHGAYATTARFSALPSADAVEEIAALKECTRLEVWRAADTNPPPKSAEEKLRGGDTSIEACLVAHSLRRKDAGRMEAAIRQLGGSQDTASYQFLCELRENEVP